MPDYGIFQGDSDIEMLELADKAKQAAECDHAAEACTDPALHPYDCPNNG